MNSDISSLETSVRHSIDGKAILFVGAGLSFLCCDSNDPPKPQPNGGQLRDELADQLGLKSRGHTLDKIAGHYVRTLGAPTLNAYLTSRLKTSKVNDDLKRFYRMNWRRIYTTNYDNAIEFSRRGGRLPKSYTTNDPPLDVPEGTTIHLNGFIEEIAPHNVTSDLKLTDFSYSESNLEQNNWSHFFRNDLRWAKSIVFIGYSMADLDISRIMLEDRSLQRKTVFVISPDADEIEIGSLGPYGSVHPIGFFEFAKICDSVMGSYTPSRVVDTYYSLIDLGESPEKSTVAPSVQVHEQLVYGKIPFGEILSGGSAAPGIKYLVPRRQIVDAAREFKAGKCRDLLIIGELASGKTFAALQMGMAYHDDAYQVYLVNDGRQLQRDLELLAKVNDRVCIIFDGYRTYLEDITNYMKRRPKNHSAILTERSIVHEMSGGIIEQLLPQSGVIEIVLDRLNEGEAAQFDKLVDFAGLWGDLSGATKQQRCQHLCQALEGSIYRILLEIIQSEKIRGEIKNILAPVKKDKNSLNFFVCAFISNTMNYDFWINDWQTFYGISNIRRVLREHSGALSHFIQLDSASVRPRAGITSTHILRNLVDDGTISDCLSDMYFRAYKLKNNDAEFARICMDLMTYSVVQPLFSEHGKLKTIVSYYQQIRSVGSTHENPDYWLQLGIAANVLKSLDVAEIAFKNAYEKELAAAKRDRRNPNTKKIDNYFARFEFDKASSTGDSDEAFALFKSGSDKIIKELFRKNNRHYPFRAAKSLGAIAARHVGSWNVGQVKLFLRTCADINKRAQEWCRENNEFHPDVSRAISETDKLLKQLEPKE